jgi:PncC family amidohydrolase
MLSVLITAHPGASSYFLGSVVAYSHAFKTSLLGVSPHTLAAHGEVSEEVVLEMLRGVFEKTGADYAIAVSGIGGPTGVGTSQSVGTVCAALGKRGEKAESKTFHINGDRKTFILATAHHLLHALFRKASYAAKDVL